MLTKITAGKPTWLLETDLYGFIWEKQVEPMSIEFFKPCPNWQTILMDNFPLIEVTTPATLRPRNTAMIR